MFHRRWLSLVVCGLLLVAANAVAQEPVDTVAKILQAEDSLTYSRYLANVLLDKGMPMEIRNLAALAIGRIGDPEGSPALMKALRQKKNPVDPAVVIEAIGILWANTPARAVKIEIPPVEIGHLTMIALTHESAAVRGAAFTALSYMVPGHGVLEARKVWEDLVAGKIADPDNLLTMGLLHIAVQTPQPYPVVLPHGPWHTKARAELIAYGLSHPDAKVAYFAAYYAARPSTTELDLTEPLLAALARPEPLVRVQALRALARRAVKNDEVIKTAEKMLAEGSTQEKIAAAEAVVALLPGEKADAALRDALAAAGTAQATSLHQAILENLANVNTEGVADFLWDVSLQKVPYHHLAAVAAARAGAKAQVAALDAQRFTADARAAMDYVELLEAAGDTAKLDWLAKGDAVPEIFVRDQQVRRRIVTALVYGLGSSPSATAAENHPEWIGDQDVVIRSLAVASLGASEDRKSLKKLTGAWKKAQNDASADVPVAVLDALMAKMSMEGQRVRASGDAAELGRRGLDDPRILVRRKAVETLYETTREMHVKYLFGAATSKSPDDYLALARHWLNDKEPLRLVVTTTKGAIPIELRRDRAPLAVDNFFRLATTGFYDGLMFHRVVPGFVAQGGDPQGLGTGDPGYTLRDEECAWPFDAGALGMASAGPDTAGSQFFITVLPTPHLDVHYTAFGHVADSASLAVVEALVPGDRIVSVKTGDLAP